MGSPTPGDLMSVAYATLLALVPADAPVHIPATLNVLGPPGQLRHPPSHWGTVAQELQERDLTLPHTACPSWLS